MIPTTQCRYCGVTLFANSSLERDTGVLHHTYRCRDYLFREVERMRRETASDRKCQSVTSGGGFPTMQCTRTLGHHGSHEAKPYGEGGLLHWPREVKEDDDDDPRHSPHWLG
jgi:hypothetical protein